MMRNPLPDYLILAKAIEQQEPIQYWSNGTGRPAYRNGEVHVGYKRTDHKFDKPLNNDPAPVDFSKEEIWDEREREKLFAKLYVRNQNAVRSYQRVYGTTDGHNDYNQVYKLLKKESVEHYIQQAKRVWERKSEVTAEWITKRLKREADGTGPDTSTQGRNKALEMLGNRIKYFPPKETKVEQSSTHLSLNITNQITPEQEQAAITFLATINPKYKEMFQPGIVDLDPPVPIPKQIEDKSVENK